MSSYSPLERSFYYEDFVGDISKYLKEKEKEYVTVSFDGLSHRIDEDKLALILSNFWHYHA